MGGYHEALLNLTKAIYPLYTISVHYANPKRKEVEIVLSQKETELINVKHSLFDGKEDNEEETNIKELDK